MSPSTTRHSHQNSNIVLRFGILRSNEDKIKQIKTSQKLQVVVEFQDLKSHNLTQ